MRPEAAGGAGREPSVHPKTREVVLQQLSKALKRGHWRIAIRSFLVLQAYRFDIPTRYEKELDRLIECCPASDLERIRAQVLSFAEMRSMRQLSHGRFGIPVDKFQHLHEFSRPAHTAKVG